MQSKIKIIKNRNGPTIDYPVVFVGNRMLFSNPTKEEDKIAWKDKPMEDEYSSDNPFQDAVNANTSGAPWWSKKEKEIN